MLRMPSRQAQVKVHKTAKERKTSEYKIVSKNNVGPIYLQYLKTANKIF